MDMSTPSFETCLEIESYLSLQVRILKHLRSFSPQTHFGAGVGLILLYLSIFCKPSFGNELQTKAEKSIKTNWKGVDG